MFERLLFSSKFGVLLYPLFWPKTSPLRHVLSLACSIEMRIFGNITKNYSLSKEHRNLGGSSRIYRAYRSLHPFITNAALNILLCIFMPMELPLNFALRIDGSVPLAQTDWPSQNLKFPLFLSLTGQVYHFCRLRLYSKKIIRAPSYTGAIPTAAKMHSTQDKSCWMVPAVFVCILKNHSCPILHWCHTLCSRNAQHPS